MGSPATPRSVLIVVTRRIGDVLLATPVMRSVKRAWPQVAVDALVFDGTQGVITANPDLRSVLTIEPRPRPGRHLALMARLLRRYDIALSLVPGDRPTLYAWLAGRWRAGLLLPARKERWKRRFLQCWVPFDERDAHTLSMHLALVDAIGVPVRPEIVVSWSADDERQVDALLPVTPAARLAVLHPCPMYSYKQWHVSGWAAVAHWLADRGWRIAVSGGPGEAEREYVRALVTKLPAGTLKLAGRLTLGGTACLLARAQLYVGPDTAVTHMAAALGVPTVALFGPTDPVKWGPWPRDHAGPAGPWQRLGSQSSGCVRLVQGEASCVPCGQEGCERHTASYSACLQELPAQRVIAAIESLVAR